jgi:hypothetical protein
VNEQRWPVAALAAAGLLFLLLATANAAGYRYGASDQAFQVPAVLHALRADTFPRDAWLLDTQARYMLFDDVVAAVLRVTGLSIETVFLLGYLLSTTLLWTGMALLARARFTSGWSLVFFGAAVAMRHRIPRTTVNSFEPYFYPRTLAFAFGVLAIAALLHRRRRSAIVLTLVATAAHITTGFWFFVLVAVACGRLDRSIRRLAWICVPIAAALGLVLWASGRLTSALTPMDREWLQVMASNDSLFPNEWPVWTWIANLALPGLLLVIHRARRRSAPDEDEAIQWGAATLVAIFLASVPFVARHWALPTQLQISRVFWLIDFLVIFYVAVLIDETARARAARGALRAVALAMLTLTVARGTYVMLREHAERTLFQVTLPASDWTAAMHWLAGQPIDVHVLADPSHATRYGSSVRVAAQRDVVLEDVKDASVALYSRALAIRVRDRRTRIGSEFAHLATAAAVDLARTYDVDYLVTAGDPLALPLAYQNRTFRIYDTRAARAGGPNPSARAGPGR